jgi:cytochrome c oxidase subunit 2
VALISGIVTLILAVCVACVAVVVCTSAGKSSAEGSTPVYRARGPYAAVLIALLGAALVFTLPRAPYGAYAGEEPALRVKVTGTMWAWQLQRADDTGGTPLVIPAKRLVEFEVTGGDVNHGFGVYDPGGHLLGQTQAMPGYVNRLRMVFDAPGTYHVACLEFCGMAHHIMVSELRVQ